MIIGEAANHIPDDVQDAHPDVPWLVMRAMRNRVVHVYFDVDPGILAARLLAEVQAKMLALSTR